MNLDKTASELHNKWQSELENLERSMNHLSLHLSILRKAAGWSAEEFGAKIGVSKQTINSIEQGIKEYQTSKDDEDLENIQLYTLNYHFYYTIRCVFEREIMNKCNPFLAYVYKYYILEEECVPRWMNIFDVYESIRKVVNTEVINVMAEYLEKITYNRRLLTGSTDLNIALIYPSNPEVIKMRQDHVDRLIDNIDDKFATYYCEIGNISKDDLKTYDYEADVAQYIRWKNEFFDAIEKKNDKSFNKMEVYRECIVSKKTLNKIQKASKLEDSGWTSVSN